MNNILNSRIYSHKASRHIYKIIDGDNNKNNKKDNKYDNINSSIYKYNYLENLNILRDI